MAAIWSLGGDLLESTTVSLELYFEHRNYIPVIGSVFVTASSERIESDRTSRILITDQPTRSSGQCHATIPQRDPVNL